LHDLFVTVEAMTPGQFGARGEGLTIDWGVHDSPFGPALVAATERGICRLRFDTDDGGADDAERDLHRHWPAATLRHSSRRTRDWAGRAFDASLRCAERPLPLLVRGTNFQVQVWRALLAMPTGTATTYGDLARAIGRPQAARAVGAACGSNRIAWLIPCHRVLRESGALGGYAWGIERKRAMLVWEGARTEPGCPVRNAAIG
jgi:AraC family transcriptional regulator of adaptative response/methylated-DNA-[protein]-cysteine methyltransferase